MGFGCGRGLSSAETLLQPPTSTGVGWMECRTGFVFPLWTALQRTRPGTHPVVLFTCVDLHAGFLAHVSQLNNHMVFASRFKFLNGVLHCTVPGFHFVDFICFSY